MVSCAVMSHMKIGSYVGVVAALGLAGTGARARVAAAPMACEALGRMTLTNATVISAESIAAGGFTLPGSVNAAAAAAFKTLPPFCRVVARLTPTPDSD